MGYKHTHSQCARCYAWVPAERIGQHECAFMHDTNGHLLNPLVVAKRISPKSKLKGSA